eukprot:CAMPEP_0116126674 /NCGR_PEP_ID=MMETSP0329-20121206/6453_1 /TAXON_ID=697910 /ORGANISM="Pseudo-nitzschia arenysensis, Strain B593" /LENGTH=908 /DNA_ID=CAMNT_0003620763 /DNA_START=187 /DNA_END=2913 /DNA_ORIENTATION=-
MRTVGNLPSVCTIVIFLVTLTTIVTGFSTLPRRVLEGWRNADIHTNFRSHRSTQQLYMSEKGSEDESSNTVSPVESIENAIDFSVLSQEDEDIENRETADDVIEATEDVDVEVIMDANAVEEDIVTDSEDKVVATEVADEKKEEQIKADDSIEDVEEETVEVEDDTVAVAVDEIEEVVNGQEKVEPIIENYEIETVADEIVETEDVQEVEEDTIGTEEDENDTVTLEVAETEEVEEDDDDDVDTATDESNEEGPDTDDDDIEEVINEIEEANEGTVVVDDNDSEEEEDAKIERSTLDDADEGQEDNTEEEIVETSVYYSNQNASDSISNIETQNPLEEERNGLNLELVANVAGDIAKDVLSLLRFGAANLLTSSLPESQRQDLLKRMGATALPPASERAEEVKEAAEEIVAQKIEVERASIQEEIAMARAEEAQKSESKWQKEKEEILQEMEVAASARVENELKIQKMKLEEENANSLREKEEALLAEKGRLEKAIQEEKERLEALKAEKAIEVDDLFAVETDEEIARNEELEALIEKRRDQQAALDSIEGELRASVANEEEQREQLESMLEKRQVQQEELNSVEANLRVQVKEIESEKARYQKLVDGLNAMKKKAQELQQNCEKSSSDDGDGESVGDDDESEKEPGHPVLGPVIVDLGYKRVHLVSAGKLGTIPVWNRNRIYRNNRAKSMAAEKIKSMELGFPGVIGLYEASSGKMSIVDGQHRVGMMAALKETMRKKMEKGDDSFDDTYGVFDEVLVEVYPEPESSAPADGDAFAEKVFLEINKAEPVKLIDMPGVASAADRQVITEAVESLQDQFGAMFSSSQRCRVPNVNVDNLRSVIFGANILKRHKLTTSNKLLEWLLEQNAALGNEYESDAKRQKLVSKKQWTKASANNFYLGLESSWLYK